MASNIRKICVISDDDKLCRRIDDLFSNGRVTVDSIEQPRLPLPDFEQKAYDVVLLGKTDTAGSGLNLTKVVNTIRSQAEAVQIILLTSPDAVREAIRAVRKGALQYKKLPVTDQELRHFIESAISTKLPLNGVSVQAGKRQRGCHQMIGSSLPMQTVYQQIRQAAATSIPVLLLGETGTGKDLTSEAIHAFSNRSKREYRASNLGALPNELVASELFGHEKGAFTGAVSLRKGLFEETASGTLFLDEIDAIDPRVQVSLLRLLEEKKFQRLGGKQMIQNHARLIAACNQDLEKLVEKGDFREDLFYRLDVFRITLPPLRERPGDIQLLANTFLKEFSDRLNKDVTAFEAESLSLLEAYDWPGNVRELKNVVQRSVITCEGKAVTAKDLPGRFRAGKSVKPTLKFEIGTSIEQVECEMILRTLATVNNNRTEAAQLLGISRRAIYNKFKKHNIE